MFETTKQLIIFMNHFPVEYFYVFLCIAFHWKPQTHLAHLAHLTCRDFWPHRTETNACGGNLKKQWVEASGF